jgi:hypothetical protein
MTKQRARERAKARAAAKAAPQAHDVKPEGKGRAGQPGKGGAKEGAGPKFDGSANIRSATGTKSAVRPTRGAARSR